MGTATPTASERRPTGVARTTLYVVASLTALTAVLAAPFVLTPLPFAPSTPATRARLQALLRRHATARATFVDIGCGDGAVVRDAARLGFGRAVGIERNPLLALYTVFRCRGLPNVSVRCADMFRLAWTGADVVYIYGGERIMAAVAAKAARELRHGAILISNSFGLPTDDAAASDAFQLVLRSPPLRVYQRR
ncbi:hypothetical protein CDCA_CDCA02G0514 [Cyanidium caldarium]|uniref:Methyltransferase domain-containing protein n=1 Tax=Cyanidium caldarium TaxID=2771 RepID=A0AAV9IQG3_CYACA|nr:hypothetical protein CDCA_CDCA02G0514 [Cyanidium caldarium]